jgi:hypothetical protein
MKNTRMVIVATLALLFIVLSLACEDENLLYGVAGLMPDFPSEAYL